MQNIIANYFVLWYDIIAAKEKEAAPKETFLFPAALTRKPFDEVKQGAQRGLRARERVLSSFVS